MNSSNQPESSRVRGLDRTVAERILEELGSAGQRVLRCLATADALLTDPTADDHHFRFAESAAYNVREALDSVVKGQAAGEGGPDTALEAWADYQLVSQLPGADEPTARAALTVAMEAIAARRQRQTFMTRKLLAWFQSQTGVAPIDSAGDPVSQYQRLRDQASGVLHSDAARSEIQALYDDAVAWFDRLFTPPSTIKHRIEQLAARPFTQGALKDLLGIVLNAHHLRLFLALVEDPSWLEPMRVAGLIRLPVEGEVWPVVALTGESRRVESGAVAQLLRSLLSELKTVEIDGRPRCAFELVRTAMWLGPEGHPIVFELLRSFPHVEGIQVLAAGVARELDASDPAQVAVADAVIGNVSRFEGYRTREILTRLVDGLTEENVGPRVGLMAAKLRRLAVQNPYLVLDSVALSMAVGEDVEPAIEVAHFLAAAIPKCRALGVASTSLLEEVSQVSGALGERLTCQVLAGASDIDRGTKLFHLVKRLASRTATGDDRSLIEDITPLTEQDLARLREAFGSPPPDGLASDADRARAWRWSMLLPPTVVERWSEEIATVTEEYGEPDVSALDRPMESAWSSSGSSPKTPEEIAALEPLQAAELVATWRPSSTDPWGVSARLLARTLETAIGQSPLPWARGAVAITRTLREPVYIDHYFRALKTSANMIGEAASEIVRAADLVHRERWEPVVLGDDTFDYEPDWSDVDIAAADLFRSLADSNALLAEDLDTCWNLATQLAETLPDDLGTSDEYDGARRTDPLHRAINSPYGVGLQAILALGGWEHRNLDAASDRLDASLSKAIGVSGAAGLALRAVIAASRPFIETIAGDWLRRNNEELFDGDAGQLIFAQTLRYSRPTRTFYDNSFARLLGAARRGADHAAAWLLIACLWDEPDYSFERIVDGLQGSDLALGHISRELPRLVRDVPADQSQIVDRGVELWRQLLNAAGTRVPTGSLHGLGGWVFADRVDPAVWLELTERTVELTAGEMTNATEVAERCRDLQPSAAALRLLLALLGHGETWERHHIDGMGVEALQVAIRHGLVDEAVDRLRERLIQRGRHDAGSHD